MTVRNDELIIIIYHIAVCIQHPLKHTQKRLLLRNPQIFRLLCAGILYAELIDIVARKNIHLLRQKTKDRAVIQLHTQQHLIFHREIVFLIDCRRTIHIADAYKTYHLCGAGKLQLVHQFAAHRHHGV